VNRLCRNAKLVEIARQYLGAEPILWLTLLRWSFPLSDDRADFHPATHREPRQYNTHAFHYDILDFKSLTLFVYLTDVESASGAHIVVEGTHNKRWHELHHLMLDDRVVEEKFGERIHVIMGKKGTAFFEETSTYHKVEVCQSRRLILSIDYVLQRTPPPQAATVGAEAGHTPVGNHTCHIPEQSGAARIQAQGRGRGHAEQRTVDWRCAYTMDTYGPALVPRADAWQPLASRGEHACGNPEAKRVRHLLANRAKGPFTLVRNEIDCTRNVAFR